MGQDWYRNTAWSDDVREVFFSKLRRARSQRDQYLVIQAVCLAEREPASALELVDLYFATRTSDFDDKRALMARATALKSAGRVADAVATLKNVMEREAAEPNLRVGGAMNFIHLVTVENLTEEFDTVAGMLGETPPAFVFPFDAWRWHAAAAVIAAHKSHPAIAREHAAAALDAAERTRSALPRHPRAGLVEKPDPDLVARLRELVEP